MKDKLTHEEFSRRGLKNRWAKTDPEARKAHGKKMVEARIKKLGQKRKLDKRADLVV